LVIQKLKETDKKYTTSDSRLWSALAADESSIGRKISQLGGCHINGLEAFSYFSVAVALAIATNVKKDLIDGAATIFFLIRIIYTLTYMTRLNKVQLLPALYLRTVVWFAGVLVSFSLLITASNNYKQ
jgi:uncharacterized MAPEG superfamily protein